MKKIRIEDLILYLYEKAKEQNYSAKNVIFNLSEDNENVFLVKHGINFDKLTELCNQANEQKLVTGYIGGDMVLTDAGIELALFYKEKLAQPLSIIISEYFRNRQGLLTVISIFISVIALLISIISIYMTTW